MNYIEKSFENNSSFSMNPSFSSYYATSNSSSSLSHMNHNSSNASYTNQQYNNSNNNKYNNYNVNYYYYNLYSNNTNYDNQISFQMNGDCSNFNAPLSPQLNLANYQFQHTSTPIGRYGPLFVNIGQQTDSHRSLLINDHRMQNTKESNLLIENKNVASTSTSAESKSKKRKFEVENSPVKKKSKAVNIKRIDINQSTGKTCKYCNVHFNTVAECIIHDFVLHNREDSKTCPICRKTFASGNNVLVHVMHHTEERLHKCNKCDKAFFDLSSLQKHEFTHFPKKPFVCNACGKDFAQKGNLKKHQFTKHKF